ncbi:Wadjet anti-phage system protein JetD domain-containing protein [Modestobacter excelsi]|uniref:Wadjet anti-phage system protein JetD domain-containing protein n=1 Tax=Modestobacter excelsi TaxID=2213161 RepID=UPI00110C999D|nr:Wadjet anti-phage system protein JetD domain-containing protein [Modestobacter excelsi]
MSGPALLTPRAGRLAAALEEWPGRTVPLADVWALFAAADPASTASPTRRETLAATLTALAAAGVLTPSKTVDRTAMPPLPTRVTLPAAAPTESAAALARAVPWRPELAWAMSARLTVGQVSALQTINAWLRDRGRDDDVVPLRERSLELFGREKQLDRTLTTALFSPGRLTLGLLRTFRARPPLAARRVGDGPVLLVVENSDTFDTLSRALTVAPGEVGHIAWGAGAAFEASVVSTADLSGVRAVAYFGDVDADGLRIPASAAVVAVAEGLPAVRPAAGLYQLLLDAGTPQPGQPVVAPERAASLARWLEEEQRGSAVGLLTGGARLPQETVTARRLAAYPGWRAGLTA